jgi:IstB-like ATP binding protein
MSDIITQLKALKLQGMADCYAELQSQGASGASASLDSSVWLLRHLLEAEANDRGIRSLRYQMNAARLPVHRNLLGFDFGQSHEYSLNYPDSAPPSCARQEPTSWNSGVTLAAPAVKPS